MPRKSVPILSSLRHWTINRFKSKLDYSGKCWLFIGHKNDKGYGIVNITHDYGQRRYPVLAHRLAWVIEHRKEVPDGLIICHRCNNPACCRPSHLYAGTPQDNATDRIKAGRNVGPLRGIKGTAHPASRYDQATKDQVIQLLRHDLHYERIAALTGINRQTLARWWNEHLASRN